jgi:hypothetical protein
MCRRYHCGARAIPAGCREILAAPPDLYSTGRDGKWAEIDGGYSGGSLMCADVKAHRRDRRLARNRRGKRNVVVIVRERGGNSVPAVFNSESQAASFIRAYREGTGSARRRSSVTG